MSRFSPGFIFPSPVVVGPLVLTFQQISAMQGGSTAGPWTAASQAVGQVQSDRIILAAIHSENNGTAGAISSVTIGGVTATALKDQEGARQRVALYYAKVPTGSTVDVVVQYAQAQIRFAVALWTITGAPNIVLTSSAAGNTSSSNPSSGALATSVGGFGIMVFNSDSASFRSATWTGATLRYNDVQNGTSNCEAFGADTTTTGASKTITATYIVDNTATWAAIMVGPSA